MGKDEMLPLTIKALKDWLELDSLFYDYTKKCTSEGEEPAEYVVVTYATQMNEVRRRAANLIQQYNEENAIKEGSVKEDGAEEEIIS